MSSSSQDIGIVGAGICGLCTALALSAKGHQVTLYERDTSPPEGGAEEAFFEWSRRGAAQFRHPHAFLAVMCNLLETNYPDLVEQFWQAGARKLAFRDLLSPELLQGYVPEPEDDSIWMLLCRRATMETVLRRYVEQSGRVRLNNQANVTGMETRLVDGTVCVTGLQVVENRNDPEVHHHDLVIDASGRTTRFPEWFGNEGVEFDVEDDDAEIVYYTRHFKLHPGEEEPPRHGKERSAGDLGYIKYGVFPGDNGHFAVILCLPNLETELREAVKIPEQFDAICNAIPGLKPWVSPEKSSPTTASFGFGDIHAVWRHFVKDGKPLALNYFAVGDAALRTNPLYGRGCSTGIMHAHMLAELLEEIPDPAERAVQFDLRTEDALRPIFRASLSEDRRGIMRAVAVHSGMEMDDAGGVRKWLRAAFGDAIAAASRQDIRVFRGAMRSFNLMEKPGEFLKDNHIRWTILRYLLRGRKSNHQTRYQHGPNRSEMLDLVHNLNNKAA